MKTLRILLFTLFIAVVAVDGQPSGLLNIVYIISHFNPRSYCSNEDKYDMLYRVIQK